MASRGMQLIKESNCLGENRLVIRIYKDMMICMATDPWQINTVEQTMVLLIIATDKPHRLVYEADCERRNHSYGKRLSIYHKEGF